MKKFEHDFDSLVHKKENKYLLNKHTKLIIDYVYKSNRNDTQISAEILPKLMGVKNQGGIRFIGSVKNKEYKYIVLFLKGDDPYWIDNYDVETGILTYYGDNKQGGTELHSTSIHGNEILRDLFNMSESDNKEMRKLIPPVFVFKKTGKARDVTFLGLAVPGNPGISKLDWLSAVWASRNDKTRFQNYKAIFSFLDTSSGSKINPNDASIDTEWLSDLRNGNGYNSDYAPITWKKWIDSGKYKILTSEQEKFIRTQYEQLPQDNEKTRMLNTIIHHFDNRKSDFEYLAIDIARMLDNNIITLDKTRQSRDGGRDGIGIYRIGSGDTSYDFSFVLEAKCYALNDSVGVKETSRLISRIKQREFGVFVTTSYIAKQAYEEIIIDKHPIIIISGIDIINILFDNNINSYIKLISFLKNY